jgi:hypothetical protein
MLTPIAVRLQDKQFYPSHSPESSPKKDLAIDIPTRSRSNDRSDGRCWEMVWSKSNVLFVREEESVGWKGLTR